MVFLGLTNTERANLEFEVVSEKARLKLTRLLRAVTDRDNSVAHIVMMNRAINIARSVLGLWIYQLEAEDGEYFYPAEYGWHYSEIELALRRPLQEDDLRRTQPAPHLLGSPKKPMEWSLKTWLAPWSYLASVTYHDLFWYPFYGQSRVRQALKSDWGRLFASWGKVEPDAEGRGYPEVGAETPELKRLGWSHFLEGFRLLGMALAESPEFKARRRHSHS